MDKKSIIGIVGFAYFNSREQQKFQREMAEYQAYRDSVALAERAAAEPLAEEADSLAAAGIAEVARQRQAEQWGEQLAAAREGEAAVFSVENDVLRIDFTTRGGQIAGVTLKDYTRYAPRGHRDRPVELFAPESARFDLEFYVKNGLRNVKVNTMDYLFTAEPVRRDSTAQIVTMRLPVADDAALVYEYVIHDGGAPARDYLVDFDVRFENMAPRMANQSTIGIAWSNTSYQNEKGFQNENMYTTLSYRFPGESSIEDLGMSEKSKDKKVSTAVNWVAFKQQFFSSVFIAPDNLLGADMAFDTAAPESEMLKSYALATAVPYTPQTAGYDFAFYFGPNKYAILKKVTAPDGEELHLERLITLGWGIFGWVNRWFVIPVFDFLRNYVSSFGVIILILAVLVKLIISPMTYKSYLSTAKMRVIKPEVDELAKKYPRQEDAMKRQQATIELREQPFLWADDLSSYDSILDLPFKIPFYGDHVSLFALLMAVSLFAFSYISYQQTASSQPQMAGMKFMMVYLMPVMMLFWFNSYSSGLCFYYLLANLLTIGQTLLIRRMVDDDKIHAAMKANAAKQQKGRKSKFQLRYEQLMREQQEQQKARRK